MTECANCGAGGQADGTGGDRIAIGSTNPRAGRLVLDLLVRRVAQLLVVGVEPTDATSRTTSSATAPSATILQP
jgi:hypothetical protein